jgi:2-amino-4-hydroxy-6-hydroxymethyldihydropteridine diphosphokinase
MRETSLILLLGSNQGESMLLLKKARTMLTATLGRIKTTSSVYRTKAWGKPDQPDFFNQVVVIAFSGTAAHALDTILEIEHKMGRVRTQKWGVRTIDIDILYFGNEVLHTEKLTVPHPALHSRRFTLVPMVEILPDFIHPVFNKTQEQLLAQCPDQLEVAKIV